ncbi:hypothetical protein KIPB_010254, partial [Kipferlia bialata]
ICKIAMVAELKIKSIVLSMNGIADLGVVCHQRHGLGMIANDVVHLDLSYNDVSGIDSLQHLRVFQNLQFLVLQGNLPPVSSVIGSPMMMHYVRHLLPNIVMLNMIRLPPAPANQGQITQSDFYHWMRMFGGLDTNLWQHVARTRPDDTREIRAYVTKYLEAWNMPPTHRYGYIHI